MSNDEHAHAPARGRLRSFRPPRLWMTEARVGLGMSMEDVARVVGVSRQEVHLWERGRRCPHVSRVLGIARCLGLDSTIILEKFSAEVSSVHHDH